MFSPVCIEYICMLDIWLNNGKMLNNVHDVIILKFRLPPTDVQ